MPDINDRLNSIAAQQRRITAQRIEIEVRNEEIESQIQSMRPVVGLTDEGAQNWISQIGIEEEE